MKSLFVPAVLLLPTLVSAHDAAALYARQATTSAAATNTEVIGSGTAAASTAFPTTLTFSLASENPTAIPLSEIDTGTAQTQSTIALSTYYAGGATQTYVPNAPGLPSGTFHAPRVHHTVFAQ